MNRFTRMLSIALACAATACGGGQSKDTGTPKTGGGPGAEEIAAAETFGPLTVGADWKSFTKVNATPSNCTDHGGRLCDFYINDVGLAAYKDENAELPVGTIIVKPSWEKNADGTPGEPGPLFVMERRGSDYNAAQGNWYFALHWENPSAKWLPKLGGPVYWQTPSPKVNYCWGCHEGYDRGMGGVPEENRPADW